MAQVFIQVWTGQGENTERGSALDAGAQGDQRARVSKVWTVVDLYTEA